MKKHILTLLAATLALVCHAQNTNYGTSSGTLGTNNSNFGYFAGNVLNASSENNAFFGTSSGQLTTSGVRNTAVGSLSFFSNTTGNFNNAMGYRSLYSNLNGIDNVAIGAYSLQLNTSGSDNTGTGYVSLYNNTTGVNNVAVGSFALYANIAGNYNTATGTNALKLNTASYNTATGYQALFSNTSGFENNATGYQSLYTNSTGNQNTAYGHQSLYSGNASGNTAIGWKALYSSNSSFNTAVGNQALYSNIAGTNNTAIGYMALLSNSYAVSNTAVGYQALRLTTSGGGNTAIGSIALTANTTGAANTAIGEQSLKANTTGFENTAVGQWSLVNNQTGNANSAFGTFSGPATSLTNTTALGYNARTTASNQVRVGNSSVTSIGGQVIWTALSDGRFKEEVKEDVAGLEFINKLRPVSYRLDTYSFDKFIGLPDSLRSKPGTNQRPRQTGFIAQEVEKTINDSGFIFYGVDAPQNDKDPYGIKYAEFVVPLVKAVQELNSIVADQQEKIDLLLTKLGENTEKSSDISKAQLFQNTPNPFSLETEIKMSLPETSRGAYVIVYNLEGKELKSIEVKNRGNDVKVVISAGEFSAGMYIYALIADGNIVDTKRMILTK